MSGLIRVGIIGDYDGNKPSHAATEEALRHCAKRLGMNIDITWLPTESLEQDADERLCAYDAFWCAPGSPYKSFTGAVNAIAFARENDRPFIGTCGGFQHAVLEYAINVLGVKNAGHQEFSPGSSTMVVTALACSLKGQTRRIRLVDGSASREIFGTDAAEERFSCSYGLSPEFRSAFESSGFVSAGIDEDGGIRIMELNGKRFYIATLFQPQLISTPENPHKLILAFLGSARRFHDEESK